MMLFQSDFERVGDSLKAVKLDLDRVREEDTYDKKKVASLSSEIVLHQTKNQQLTKDLQKAHNEVLIRNFFATLVQLCSLLLPFPSPSCKAPPVEGSFGRGTC